MKPTGLYIHIPFCRNKCLYCDFYSGGARIAEWNLFTGSLIAEARSRREEIRSPVKTLYLGGGTPSIINCVIFSRFFNDFSSIFDLTEVEEMTIEVNPEDVTEEKCRIWQQNGFNRVSLGVQSMNDEELRGIGRLHTSSHIKDTIKMLRRFFDNISIDIMLGLPGQSLKSYRETLESVIKFNPEHISSYSLMLEEGTAMTHLVNNHRIILPEEEEWMRMFEMTPVFLEENGYRRYEISNYAKPGFRSIHNSRYWLGFPYLGLGPGAHSYDGQLKRRFNPCDLKGYVNHYSGKDLQPVTPNSSLRQNFYEEEELSSVELKEEMIMTRLRMIKGLDISEFKQRFGEKERDKIIKKSRPYIESGSLLHDNGFLRLTSRGIMISDRIIASLF